jgi:hypothetical protein
MMAKIKFTIPSKSSLKRIVPWIIIYIGVLLRLIQYLFNRSLWLDEAFLATNFINKNLPDLLRAPMDYTESMIAPIGFMAITKAAITFWGNSDIILRLYPFVCSIISLLLFRKLAQSYVSQRAAIIALFLISVSGPLIYQASEFKPYSSDIAFTIVLLLLVPYIEKSKLNIGKVLVLTVAGGLATWFSFPAPFLLAAVGCYLAFIYAREKQWNGVLGIVIVSTVWLLIFAIQYKIVVGKGVETSAVGQWLIEFWNRREAFMPNPFSKAGLDWLSFSFARIFSNPSEWIIKEIPMILCLIGFIFMLIKRRRVLFILAFPIILAAIASHFRLYPFYGRMLFFLMPALFLSIGESIAQIPFQALKIKHFKVIGTIIQIVLLVTLINYLPHFQTREELKPVLEYVQNQKREYDKIYLFFAAEPAFRYYSSFYGFNYDDCKIIVPIPKKRFVDEIDYFRSKQNLSPVSVEKVSCILGVSTQLDESRLELAELKGTGRIWFIFSHANQTESDFLNYLDNEGTRLDQFIQPGASVYLYEM